MICIMARLTTAKAVPRSELVPVNIVSRDANGLGGAVRANHPNTRTVTVTKKGAMTHPMTTLRRAPESDRIAYAMQNPKMRQPMVTTAVISKVVRSIATDARDSNTLS
jgi:hypothetical protein